MICYDNNSASFRALFNSRKNSVKTLFLEGDLEGTFTFYHFLSSSFWKILLTLILFSFFFTHPIYTPLSLCYYFFYSFSIHSLPISLAMVLLMLYFCSIPFYFILHLDSLSLCLQSFGLYGPSVLVLCFTVCSYATTAQLQK